MRNHPLLVILMAFTVMGSSRCVTNRVTPDSSMLAIAANDATVIIDGCGQQPMVGSTYCRVTEGNPTAQHKVSIIVPPSKCLSDKSCVSIKVFYADGSPDLGFEVPVGITRQDILWSDLVHRATFEKNDRGQWIVIVDYKWLDQDGREQRTRIEGNLIMRVLSASYVPLHQIKADPAFVWRWVDNGVEYAMTTAGRAYAGTRQ